MALLKGRKRIKGMYRPVHPNYVRKAMVVVLVNESRFATDFLKSRSRKCEYSSSIRTSSLVSRDYMHVISSKLSRYKPPFSRYTRLL
jgi:hypothetical protein